MNIIINLKNRHRLGIVVHTCNPSTLGGQGRQISWAQEFKTSQGNMKKAHLYKKTKTKISQVWCWVLNSQLLRRLRQKNHLTQGEEVAVSQDHTTAVQPGWKSVTTSQKKNKTKQKPPTQTVQATLNEMRKLILSKQRFKFGVPTS